MSIEMEKHAHHKAVLVRIQRANTIGKLFGEHGHSTIRKVYGSTSKTSFTVKGRMSVDIMGDVGNMDLKMPAVGTSFNVNGVVKVTRCLSVDRHYGQEAKISASFEFGVTYRAGRPMDLLKDLLWKSVWQVMLANQYFDIDAKLAGSSQDFNDAAGGENARAWETRDLDVHNGAIELRQADLAR